MTRLISPRQVALFLKLPSRAGYAGGPGYSGLGEIAIMYVLLIPSLASRLVFAASSVIYNSRLVVGTVAAKL